MTKFFLLGVAIAAVITLGLLIDTQSRARVVYPDLTGSAATSNVCAIGRVEGLSEELELRPQLAGRVRAVLVQEGQVVEKNQPLLQLDDEEYRCEVALATAELDQAESQRERLVNGARAEERAEAVALYQAKMAELERVRLSWKRIEALGKSQAISSQEVDNERTSMGMVSAQADAAKARADFAQAPARKDEVQLAEARIRAAKARLELAKVQVARAVLLAPCRAEILKLDVRIGEIAGPTSSLPAITVADTSRLRVRAFVEEFDAPNIRVGMAAKVTADGLPGQQFPGRISGVSPRMSRKTLFSDQPAERFDTKTREVWIDLDKSESLVLGLRVDVFIDTKSEVPTSPTKPAGPPT